MIYLDYAASTPVAKEVLDTYYETALKYYANPNSSHLLGIQAQQLIQEYTQNIAQNLNVSPQNIIYTSGATETNNLVIKGICERYKNYGNHIILSSLEHNSILAPALKMQEAGFEIDLLPLTKEGLVDILELKKMLRPETILVSICSVDSELGIVQPIAQIATILKEYPHTFFHTDASQAIGKVTIDYQDVDLITITPHKFYGLNGGGILIKKDTVSLKPQLDGGKSTTIYRSGTPDLANIAAMSKALDIALKTQKERYEYVLTLNKKIIDTLSKYPSIHLNNTSLSMPYIVNFSVKKIKSTTFTTILANKKIYVSSKTSCCPLNTPSKLVYALTKDKTLANTSLRVSLSHLTTTEEIDTFLKIMQECLKELEQNGKI